ncbi:CRISPR-associated protein Csx19 [Nonomuraea sp. NPDC049714]|uniref:type III-D CRISPR-associated protein Csx19 n=1 Tax=Nonomuraea sp. NPDC049714 TaxID=3364357 RepID=UPI0037BAC1B0
MLYTAYADDLALGEALAQAGVEGGCALLTSPAAYRVAKVQASECRTPTGAVDLDPVFEARVFTSQVELRWVESGRRAVVLAEQEHLLPSAFPGRLEPMRAVTTLPAHYLVWGKDAAPAAGWVTLRSRQVGTLALPMAGVAAERVRLVAREYVVADEEHGNAYVAEERLVGFEPYAVEGPA